MTAPRRVHLVSLGCPKNRVDSEGMLGQLVARGWEVTDDPTLADALVVNTCSFIQPATEESIETVLELAQLRRPGQRLVVAGCMVQRYGEGLAAELPEVDGFLGTGEMARLPALLESTGRDLHVGEAGWLEQAPIPRAGFWRPHSAYLKITEGCHRRCSYCIIPSLRGPLRSRALEPLLDEARHLASQGVRELCIVGQDTTAWGRDLPGTPALATLLEALAGVEELRWIRVLYAHPRGLDDRLLDVMASHDRICAYLDLPLQHVAAPVLKAMGRGMDRGRLEALVHGVRQRVPGITLRTTFMVGFPGESEQDFESLLDFVRRVPFERAGVFRYFAEEGTPAAELPDQVPPEEQQARQDALVDAQAEVARRYHQGLVGGRIRVLVDGPSSEHEMLLMGRHEGQAPEIDGGVHLGMPPHGARPGDVIEAVVTDADEVDLVAEPVLDASQA
jgi:ribosomal protein S12 methylthiotransferase